MGQITIYLDEEVEQQVRTAARNEGVPVSRWIAHAIQKQTCTAWPESIRSLPGSWDDVERPENLGSDSPRENL